MTETLSILVHGGPGAGKSWLGQSTPAPRLVLDAEGGSRNPKRMRDGVVERQRKIVWDPLRDAPPVDDGTWDTCIVFCRDFIVVQRTYDWLNHGEHPFKSVVVDSLTEIQKRCKDSISGVEAPDQQAWGLLLIRMERLIRDLRDLTFHQTTPLDAVVIIALTRLNDYGKYVPAIQGALGVSLPGFVDVEGFLRVDVNDAGEEERRMLISPRDGFEAKDRTHDLSAHYGPVVTNPDVEHMLFVYNDTEAHA